MAGVWMLLQKSFSLAALGRRDTHLTEPRCIRAILTCETWGLKQFGSIRL
jgi:hypothetical protein